MAGIGNIVQQGIKYTSKGGALVRKQLGLLVQDFAQEGVFKGVKIPEGAVSYDAVKVGRNFNAGEFFTDIFTFRDKDGKILQRMTNEVDGEDSRQVVKWFKELTKTESYYDDDIMLNARKTSGYERVNGRVSKVWDEVVTKTDEENPMLTIFKRTTAGSQETHRLSEHVKGSKPKFIENIYNLFHTSRVTGNRLDGLGYFELASSKVSDEGLKEIAEHPYLFPTMSKYNKFIYRMYGAIDNDSNVAVTPEIRLFKQASCKQGFYRDYEGSDYQGTIHINKLDREGYIRPRNGLTNAIAHEYGHHAWDEKVTLCEFDDDLDEVWNSGFSEKERELILKYKKSIDNYISADQDYGQYSRQFAERVARAEGREAATKYSMLEQAIENKFPGIHPEQFYDIGKEANDSNEGLMSILDMLGEKVDDLDMPEEISFYTLLTKFKDKV